MNDYINDWPVIIQPVIIQPKARCAIWKWRSRFGFQRFFILMQCFTSHRRFHNTLEPDRHPLTGYGCLQRAVKVLGTQYGTISHQALVLLCSVTEYDNIVDLCSAEHRHINNSVLCPHISGIWFEANQAHNRRANRGARLNKKNYTKDWPLYTLLVWEGCPASCLRI